MRQGDLKIQRGGLLAMSNWELVLGPFKRSRILRFWGWERLRVFNKQRRIYGLTNDRHKSKGKGFGENDAPPTPYANT
ncbi:MAG: hypothetical protein AMXMBFR16_05330 [Candidatus Uhrbacteria bacterium]